MQVHHSSHRSALSQRAIALAALTQAVYLVDSVANKGMVDSEDCRTMLESIFTTTQSGESPAALYGTTAKLNTGIRICTRLLQGQDIPQAKTLMTYSASLIALDKKLSKDHDMLQKLGEGINRIDKQHHYFGDAMHNSIIAAVADLYGETISTMKPRIIVRGKTEFLSQNENTRKVRALLMAGLRAAHQWHQHGGGSLTLLLRRKALLRELKQLKESFC